MITQRTRGIYNLHVLSQCIAVVAMYWIWKGLFPSVYNTLLVDSANYALYCGLAVFGLLLGSGLKDRKGYWASDSFIGSNRMAFAQTLHVGLVIAVYLMATRDAVISRVFIFSYLVLVYVLLLLSNRYVPMWLFGLFFSGNHVERTLLIGPVDRAQSLRRWLHHKKNIGIETIGILTEEEHAEPPADFPILGRLEQLEKIVHSERATQVILLAIPQSHDRIRSIAQSCERMGARFLLVLNFDELLKHRVSISEDEGFRFISLRQEPLEDPLNRFLKRTLDLCVAWPVVLLVLPWTTLLVWLFQRIQSPGPVFYRQIRSGLQNQPFEILKYRTMHVNNPDEARQASDNDNRIYRAGHWFRKLSIDELPQFWNVLEGTMSVVGPRPHLSKHDAKFAQVLSNYSIRALVKPGITGLAQTRGFRGETKTVDDIARRLESDLVYLENWSLGLDILLVLRTVWQMIFPPRTAL